MSILKLFWVVDRARGRVALGRPVVLRDDEPWGMLGPLRDDPVWRSLIPEVGAEQMSHALHGYLDPLLRQPGVREVRSTLRMARRVLPVLGRCLEAARCAAHDEATCLPCPKTPACYVPPAPAGAEVAAREVARAWVDGHVVVVPVGEEFVLRG